MRQEKEELCKTQQKLRNRNFLKSEEFLIKSEETARVSGMLG